MSHCVETINVVCKHVEASDVFYVDCAPLLSGSETVSSVTSVTASDSAITVTSSAVISSSTTVTKTTRDADGNTTTTSYVIAANKGIQFNVAGGTSGGGCSKITVVFVKSTGKTDAVDCLIEVHGENV